MVDAKLLKRLSVAVAKNFPDQKKFLSRLVKTKSINPNTPDITDKTTPIEKGVSDLIYRKLKSLKFSPRRLAATQKRPNIVCYEGPSRYKKSLILNGHMDTSPPPEEYKNNPFSGAIKGNKLYGIGALDMKGPLTAYIYALKAIKDAKIKLVGRLILEFVVDEEPGANSKLGTHHLMSRGIKAKAAIIAEPGGQIGIGHRGGYRFKLTTYGEAAHTGTSSWQKGLKGKSAIADMVRAIEILKKIDIPFKPSRVFSGKKPMITFPTMIQGGVAINVVPDKCVAYGDVRLMPGNSHKQIRLIIEEKLAQLPDLKYSLDDLLFVPAFELDDKEDIVQSLASSYTKVTKQTPTIEGIGPWNDAWMMATNDIPTITQVPLKGNGTHTQNEWVDLTSLRHLTTTLAVTIIDFLERK